MRHTRIIKNRRQNWTLSVFVQCACMATTSMMATAPSYQWGFFNQRFLFHPYFSSFSVHLAASSSCFASPTTTTMTMNVTPHIEWLGYLIFFVLFIDFALWYFHNSRCFDSSSQRAREKEIELISMELVYCCGPEVFFSSSLIFLALVCVLFFFLLLTRQMPMWHKR